MDQAQCHIHGTSHQIEWLVELRALLGGLGSTDGSVVVAVDSSLVAVVVDSSLVVVVVADSNPVAVAVEAAVVAVAVGAVAVVEQVDSTAFGPEPQGEGGLLLCQLQVKT